MPFLAPDLHCSLLHPCSTQSLSESFSCFCPINPLPSSSLQLATPQDNDKRPHFHAGSLLVNFRPAVPAIGSGGSEPRDRCQTAQNTGERHPRRWRVRGAVAPHGGQLPADGGVQKLFAGPVAPQNAGWQRDRHTEGQHADAQPKCIQPGKSASLCEIVAVEIPFMPPPPPFPREPIHFFNCTWEHWSGTLDEWECLAERQHAEVQLECLQPGGYPPSSYYDALT